MSKLTIKQLNFVVKLHELGNQSEAYRYAYDSDDMAEDTINNEASKLAKNPKITTMLKVLQAETAERIGVSIDRIAQELSFIAFGSIADLLNEDGSPKPFGEYTDQEKSMLKKFKVHEDELTKVVEIEGWDKLSALDKLAKFTGFYELDHSQQKDNIKSDEENEALYQKLIANQKAKKEALKGRGKRIEREVLESQNRSK